MDAERQGSFMALLQRILPLADQDVPGYMPDHFVQLCDGISLYAILRIVAPGSFPPTTVTEMGTDTEAATTPSLTHPQFEADVQRREANLSVLLRRVLTYVQQSMSPSPSVPAVTQGLDVATLAELPGDGAPNTLEAAAYDSPVLMQLVGVVTTLVVLSGVKSVLAEVKSLPRSDQVVLSNWVRELMGVYDLKPRRHSHSGAAAAPSSSGGAAPKSSAVDAAKSPLAAQQQLSQQPPAAPAAATPASTEAASTAAAAPAAPSSSATPAAAAGSATQPMNPAAAAPPASVASTATTATAAAPSRPAAGDEEDEGFYRNATYQLRNELAELKAQLTSVQDAYRISKEDKETAENKYRLLLGEQAKTSATAAAAAAASSAQSQKEILKVWQDRCSKKDETIATLTSRIEEQSGQVSALKDAVAAHEMALQTLRRRLKTAEEGVMVRSEERREALEKLAVAEDKLAAQMKARVELEGEVEDLNSRILVLTVEQDRLRDIGNDDTHGMNNSFGSNGSMDRVMGLENELDEVRQQRDSLQRQVGILQRQVAATPAPVADVTTANDTWRAQLRQVEREREDLRQQLTNALERVGDLQQQAAAAQALAASATATANEAKAAAAAAVTAVAMPTQCARPTPPGEGNTSSKSDTAADASTTPKKATATAADESDVDTSSIQVMNLESPLRTAAGGGPEAEKLRDTAQREQVVLSSLLLQYSYRNLLLQQHETLLHKDVADAETARRLQVEQHSSLANRTASTLLTRQRRDVEQGLLESVLHGAKLRMMRMEQ